MIRPANTPFLTRRIGRREVLKRSALLGSALLLGGSIAQTWAATPQGTKTQRKTMGYRGVNYDTGTNYDASYALVSRFVWTREILERDMKAIRKDLHCNAVTLYGTDIARLVGAAEVALSYGLEVWFQPRLMDSNPKDRLEHLAEAAREAESLRERGSVTLNIGVETSIFMSAIIPGNTYGERMEMLGKSWRQSLPDYVRRLNAHLETAAHIARETFSGPLTYSSGEWEPINWAPFDIIGLSFYRNESNHATYASTLQEARAQTEKPVVITEFGACTFKGAGNMGGMGWDIVDYSKARPKIKEGYVRSEKEQADYLAELLDIYEAEGLDGAFIYDFSTPGSPYSPDPKYDLDMASYALVKALLGDNEMEATRWEPKEAFGRVGEIYGRLEGENALKRGL